MDGVAGPYGVAMVHLIYLEPPVDTLTPRLVRILNPGSDLLQSSSRMRANIWL